MVVKHCCETRIAARRQRIHKQYSIDCSYHQLILNQPQRPTARPRRYMEPLLEAKFLHRQTWREQVIKMTFCAGQVLSSRLHTVKTVRDTVDIMCETMEKTATLEEQLQFPLPVQVGARRRADCYICAHAFMSSCMPVPHAVRDLPACLSGLGPQQRWRRIFMQYAHSHQEGQWPHGRHRHTQTAP